MSIFPGLRTHFYSPTNWETFNEVTITTEEYRELLEAKAGITVFSRYVNMVRYSVDREVCAAILGFDLTEVGEEAGTDLMQSEQA